MNIAAIVASSDNKPLKENLAQFTLCCNSWRQIADNVGFTHLRVVLTTTYLQDSSGKEVFKSLYLVVQQNYRSTKYLWHDNALECQM